MSNDCFETSSRGEEKGIIEQEEGPVTLGCVHLQAALVVVVL